MNYIRVDEDIWVNFDNIVDIVLNTHKKTGKTKIRFWYAGGYNISIMVPTRIEALQKLKTWFAILDEGTANFNIKKILSNNKEDDKNELQK